MTDARAHIGSVPGTGRWGATRCGGTTAHQHRGVSRRHTPETETPIDPDKGDPPASGATAM